MKKFFTILSLLYAIVVSSQWNTNVGQNLQVSSLNASVDYTAKTSDGKTYVFFLEENSTSFYVPRVQLLDKDGNKLFGENGIVVNPTAKFSSYIQVSDCAVDADNNLIMSFFATGESKLYANKISPQGVNVWGPSGIVVSTGALPKIVALSSGVVISYILSNKGNLMKFDKDTGAPLWTAPIVFTSPITGFTYTSVTELSKLSDDSFISVFIAKNTSFGVSGRLLAQRYDGSGNPLWTTPVALTSTTGVQYNIRYNHIIDNDNLYFPYFTSGITGSKFDAFVQKIKADGSLPWGENGKDVSTGPNYEKVTSIAINGNDVWSISTFTNSSQGLTGEYVQKFDKESGNPAFASEAKEIYPLASGASAKVHQSSLGIINNRPVFVTMDNSDASVNAITLTAVELDTDGTISREKAISGSSVKGNINFVSFPNQSVAVWADKKNTSPQLFSQNYTNSATLTVENIKTKTNYNVYPNPTVSKIYVKTDKQIAKNLIYDAAGKLVISTTSNEITMMQLNAGIYILTTIFKNGESESSKIIKK